MGNSDVAMVEDDVLTRMKKAVRWVKVEAQSGKCMVDATAKAQEVVGDSTEEENIVFALFLPSVKFCDSVALFLF